jgi:hypothetical protein
VDCVAVQAAVDAAIADIDAIHEAKVACSRR